MEKNKFVSLRLIIMNVLQWAIWGAYLTSMGSYLSSVGMGAKIGLFYSTQGFVSIIMPTIMGIIADRYISAEKLLGFCHMIAGAAMIAAGYYGFSAGADVEFSVLFPIYTLSVAFYMPSIGLSNSVAFSVLEKNKFDTIKDFPPIRVFGTVGFILCMLFVNFMRDSNNLQYQMTYNQFLVSGILGVILAVYCFTLPKCPLNKKQSFADAFGLKTFKLFKYRDMALFFIFSMLIGVALQITNSYGNPFISHFANIPEFANSWGAQNANALISISQMSEALAILIIPFVLKRFGIKKVMLIAIVAWFFRFGLFGLGNPGDRVWMLITSMIVYGVAFDFFNISGVLYVNERTSENIRSSAQGLFMLMTNGIGAAVGTLAAGYVVNHFVDFSDPLNQNWSAAWYVFTAYAFVVGILFLILFKNPKTDAAKIEIE